jgi:galactose-1-phosphate uridylyltransferase
MLPRTMPVLQLDQSADARQISFQNYQYHSYCTVHKSLAGAPTKCPLCQVDDDSHGKVLRKKHLTRQRKTIGDFMLNEFLSQYRDYRYHLQHVILLGKNFAVRQRKEAFREVPGAIMIQRDFAD